MPTQLQLRRGNTAQTSVFTGATAEITVDTDKKVVVVHDGSTAGGFALARESILATVYTHANGAFDKANSSNVIAQAAFDKANSVSALAFSTVVANGTSLVADANNDTLTITSDVANGIFVTANASSDTLDIGLINSGVTASGYGDSISVPTFVVDAKGRLTSASNTTIRSTSTSQTGVVQLTDSISSTSTTTAATPNSVKTAYDLAATKFNSSGGTISGDTIVTGNLIVNGETTTVNTSTVSTSDSLLKLANNNIAADSLDIGFYGTYNATGQKYAGLIRQAGSNFFLFKDLTTDPTSNTLAVGSLTASNTATLRANITGGTVSSLASAIAVVDGGTGVTTSTGTGSVTLNTSPTLSNVSVTSVNVTNTTISTSTTTGALTVAGGVGVSGNLHASFLYTQGQAAATIGDALALAIALG